MSAQTETCTTPINATTNWSRMGEVSGTHKTTPVNNQQSQPIVMPQAEANWDTVLVQVVRGKPEDRWGLWPEDASLVGVAITVLGFLVCRGDRLKKWKKLRGSLWKRLLLKSLSLAADSFFTSRSCKSEHTHTFIYIYTCIQRRWQCRGYSGQNDEDGDSFRSFWLCPFRSELMLALHLTV